MIKNSIKKYISIILTTAIILASLTVGWVAFGDDLVAINSAYFPDDNWRTIVSKHYDTNHDGYLSAAERNSKTYMSISGYLEDDCGEDAEIETLTGIELFPNLERLYAASLGLKSLDVSKLNKLSWLSCMGNKITSLLLGSNINLTNVNCSANELIALVSSGCPNLQVLDCSLNKLKSLNVSSNSNLVDLRCHQNELTTLNLSANTLLQSLSCSKNHIKELDLSNNLFLTEVKQNMIGDQWVEANAQIAGTKVLVPYSFKDRSKLVSTSLDTVADNGSNDSSESTKISGHNGTGFLTDDVQKFDKTIKVEQEIDGEIYFVDKQISAVEYEYNVNNPNCENMTVIVEVTRQFYQVQFFTDESMTEVISKQFVKAGDSAIAPEITEYPEAKIFGGWSDTFDNIISDKNIYIKWVNEHVWTITQIKNGDIHAHCTDCGMDYSFAFSDVLNAEEGTVSYIPALDAVEDGIINAKDYAKIYRMINNN